MPVMMTVMFLNFASGLNLYWFVSSLLCILETKYVRKHFMGDQPAAPALAPVR